MDQSDSIDYQFGGCRLDTALHVLVTPTGDTVRLPSRAFATLLYLVEHAGELVEKSTLMGAVWPHTVVEENNLHQCIFSLRRALGETPGDRKFILTVPGRGFTFVAHVTPVPRPQSEPRANGEMQSAATPQIQSVAGVESFSAGAVDSSELGSFAEAELASRRQRMRRSRWRSPWLAAITIGGAALVAVVAWLLWPEGQWTVVASRPFVTDSAIQRYPAFSPDGTMLAYSAGTDIFSRKVYVRSVAGWGAIKITSDGFDDESPSWASDGAHIAYLAVHPGEPCRIMLTSVPAWHSREVGRCNGDRWQSLSWQPRSNDIYYSDALADHPDNDAVYRLDVATGKKTLVTRFDPDSARGDSSPRVSPDGDWLAYVRELSAGRLELRIRNLKSGRERVLGSAVGTSSDGWTNDSKTVLWGTTALIGSKIRAYPIDGGKPYLVYSTSGLIDRLAMSRTGLLAVSMDNVRTNLARAPSSPAVPPEIIDSARGMTWSPAIAPDGTLAFASNRSGENAIWMIKNHAPAVQTLIGDEGDYYLNGLTWAPDGRYLAFVEFRDDATAVKVVAASGAVVTEFPVAEIGEELLTWTPDSKALLLFDKTSSRTWRVNVGDPSERIAFAASNWRSVTFRQNGVFAIRADKPGIWQIDAGTRLITPQYRHRGPIVFLGDAILMPEFPATGRVRVVAQPIDGGPARPVAYLPDGVDFGMEGIADAEFAVNPATRDIVYVKSVVSDTDIDLLHMAKR